MVLIDIKVGLYGMTVTMLLFLLGTKCKFVVIQMSRSPILQIMLCITDHIYFWCVQVTASG